MERELWLAVLKAQRDLGVEVPDGVVEAYERVVDQVDLESIAARERVTRHDVKARIEEFVALAGDGASADDSIRQSTTGEPIRESSDGHGTGDSSGSGEPPPPDPSLEHIHKGMTSRDLTENVEQLQIRQSLELVRDRIVAALAKLAARASEYAILVIAGRSHNVPAQATTLGKRFATTAEELLAAYHRIESLLDRYAMRGIKGPVGTAADQLDLLGSPEKLAELESRVAG
ncbi:MAG: lyase family protein, partial [Micromonosporaceae bacterium]